MAIRTDHKAKMRVRKGDSVQVISGKDRGVTGKVILTLPRENRVLVEGVNRIKKHTKIGQTARGAKTGGIVTQEAPIHVSNVMLLVEVEGKKVGSRVGYRLGKGWQKTTANPAYPYSVISRKRSLPVTAPASRVCLVPQPGKLAGRMQ